MLMGNRLKRIYIFLIALGFMSLIPACATDKNRLNLVKLNMSKQEVAQVMGGEGQAVSSERTKNNEVKEIWDYNYENFMTGENTSFRFIFLDDKLAQWSQAK